VKRSVRRWILIGAGAIFLIAIVAFNLAKNDTPSVSAKLGDVVEKSITSTITAPGRIRSVSSVDISAEVPGRVVELKVAEGDSVRQGDLLLRLDDTQYKSRVAQAQAGIKSAGANLVLAEARLAQLDKDRNRLEALKGKDLASAEAVEKAHTDYDVQHAEVEARREEVSRMRANLEDAEADLRKTAYRSPVDGIVSRLSIEMGEIVMTGTMNNPASVIMTISDLGMMQVEAEVDESDIVDVHPGQPAKITVDAIPDTTFKGHVVTVGNSGRQSTPGASASEEVVNFEVKVQFDHPDRRLKPGMTADVEVETQIHPEVLAVPIQALVARSRLALEKDEKLAMKKSKKKVFVHAAPDTLKGTAREKWEKEVVEGVFKLVNNEAVFKPVKTGISDEAMIEVAGDLAAGDKVVTGPYRVLKDMKEGVRVKPAKDGDEEGGGKKGKGK
jgi:HlyD family secretion protein